MTTKTTPDVMEKVRPLSLGASRNLQKLIDNDFSALREHLEQYASNLLEQAETKIRKKWAAKGLDVNAFVDRATALVREFEDAQQALIREALVAGIQLEKKYHNGSRNGWTADAFGLKEAVAAEQKVIRTNHSKAISELTIQHKGAERRVLLASVTGEAEDLLQSLPTAAQLMAQVAKNKALTA
jgi:hypothetical protein